MNEFTGSMSHYDERFNSLQNKVDSLVDSFTAFKGIVEKNFASLAGEKAAAVPRLTLSEIVTQIKDIGILIAMAGGAIIFISTSISSTPVTGLQKDIAYVNARIDMLTQAQRMSTVYKTEPARP